MTWTVIRIVAVVRDIARSQNDACRSQKTVKGKVTWEMSVVANPGPSFTSALPEMIMEDFSQQNRVFKPTYLASISGQAHAIGAILDYNNHAYLFFDPNEGVAEFNNPQHMSAWLQNVEPEDSSQYTAFFTDTKTK